MRLADIRRLQRFLIGGFVTILSTLVDAGGGMQQRGAAARSTQPPVPYEVDNAVPSKAASIESGSPMRTLTSARGDEPTMASRSHSNQAIVSRP